MLRKLVIGLGLVILGSTPLYARQGTVVTKDGHSYEGDVVEQGDLVEISGVAGLPGPVKMNKGNVASINYPDKVSDEVHAALKKLDARDVNTRISLAKAAMQAHAYEAARDALNEAAAIEPKNREVSELMLQLGPHLPAPATRPMTVPATLPASSEKQPVAAVARRQVTPAEINVIRQCEWRGEDDPSVKIQIKADAKKRFLEGYPDLTLAEFSRMTPNQQAVLMLSKGSPAVASGVQISTDPASVAEFKKSVNPIVLHSCGTCHNGGKAGSFSLVPALNNAGIYTNFLTLQQYTAAGGPMVDRVNPDASMLLQYLLDPTLTTTPHPQVKDFKPAVRTKTDPRYLQVLHWIQSLNPIVPHYGIDLTRETPAPGKAESGK
ncbi:MAG TPA: tetratricopeptide repeat protein [Tepidisphaeraceae bacterium]|jgi:hypothetical protein|nr:tetratricopeptide repeat protein [Tepidisphaeraceae bacterium]